MWGRKGELNPGSLGLEAASAGAAMGGAWAAPPQPPICHVQRRRIHYSNLTGRGSNPARMVSPGRGKRKRGRRRKEEERERKKERREGGGKENPKVRVPPQPLLVPCCL